ncbi:MAG: ATP-binding cassette domain-containing protein [Gemmatimonadetes bacterium]|nr:ATP-binding cassette domain-containing protein [Gemmatimonadota bacterium]NIR79114.1 ATP-binding cassette domain-containing protein [Gemmatimonadota bacterium]NIT87767.1 ATP-binding cassette domain-containing protein [Gemmatimonadota bacterium]NIU31630.1 ATP-binding cassette domain-containing protein [Gemmatimonadota bacterium]NIU36257.1 ATP-binding cassette domain-containing protein [Gemmatimonadota bacterium]
MLTVRDAGRRLDDGWIWRKLSFRLPPGDRLGLVGPSGSGKTLLLRALAALDPLDEGTIELDDRALDDWEVPEYRARVTYVPQEATLAEGTVWGNLQAPFAFGVHQGKVFDEERAAHLLRGLGRGASFLEKESGDLSGGERQVAALVRSLLLEPRILLLDEPAASMDDELAAGAEDLVSDWIEEDGRERALIWTSHRADRLERVTSRRIEL